jgi:putative nucleotidyltransferase with HDIG domain
MAEQKEKPSRKDQFIRKIIAGFTVKNWSIKISFFLIVVIFIPLLFPSGRSLKYTDLNEGSIVNKKVIAPFTFPVLKTEEQLTLERNTAENKIPNYFDLNDSVADEEINKYEDFWNFISKLPENINLRDSVYKSGNKIFKIDSIFNRIYLEYKPGFSKEEIILLFKYFRMIKNDILFKATKQYLIDSYDKKIINISKARITNERIIVINKGVEEEEDINEVNDLNVIQNQLINYMAEHEPNAIYIKLIKSYIKPNLIFNKELTEQRKNDAIASVPLALDLVYENERIIDANERVTKNIEQKLISLEIALAERSALEGNWQYFLSYFGKYLLTILIMFILAIYLYKNRPIIFANNKKLFLVNLIIFLQVGLGAIIVGPLGWSAYLIPTTISGMLLGILFDLSIGFIGTAVVGMLIGGILGLDYSIATMTVIAGIVAVYSVSQIRTRNQIFSAILFILIAYAASLFAFNTLRYEDLSVTLQAFIIFILPNAILSPFITYMSLGVFEKAFDITTDVTLLELSDMNHPLLKQQATKAPGTFHHSIIVGNLAEAAAKEIHGANSLLARVGSYYHDIGKMGKPEYFVENQKGGENKHESLAPNMSALILAAHVKNGIELAQEYNIPKKIRDFIPEHHGTNVMTFFYNKALESSDVGDINIEDYRYPGPKPQSKETAIVMLADTVEAAAKSLKSPTPGRLRKLVGDLVEKRFLEGELEDCDLTMRDLKGIIEGFVSVLIGIYHERIEYPEEKNKKNTRVKIKEQNSQKNNNGNSTKLS